MASTLKTQRLILRAWQEDDLEPFAKLNADQRVREFFPSCLSREESDASVKNFSEHIQKYGWGLFATCLIETEKFIGFIGMQHVNFEAPFTPAVEIGWRIAHEHWGKGYATEGAKAVLEYAFNTVKLKEIVSFTAEQNMRSRNVMEKIGMQHIPEKDFDHPQVPDGHALRRHVFYQASSYDFLALRAVKK